MSVFAILLLLRAMLSARRQSTLCRVVEQSRVPILGGWAGFFDQLRHKNLELINVQLHPQARQFDAQAGQFGGLPDVAAG